MILIPMCKISIWVGYSEYLVSWHRVYPGIGYFVLTPYKQLIIMVHTGKFHQASPKCVTRFHILGIFGWPDLFRRCQPATSCKCSSDCQRGRLHHTRTTHSAGPDICSSKRKTKKKFRGWIWWNIQSFGTLNLNRCIEVSKLLFRIRQAKHKHIAATLATFFSISFSIYSLCP